ncbi:MAG: acetolactate synthase large subunit, partial [Rikenellaceae bacterium]|nr:acetolactate synthase large subunit [Rikenellaceae bacterium]
MSQKHTERISGVEALIRSLLEEHVDTLFGYPGGQVINIYDGLYRHAHELSHILTRHEQGAVHAAQGYARATGRVGVCLATSGPGATNLITGITDAMIDSTPLVCITGQVPSALLGSDAFQEADIITMTIPVTKWNFQVTRATEIPEAIARAFYIARTGRPGPVLIDITKNAQIEAAEFSYTPCTGFRSYTPKPALDTARIDRAMELINGAKQPLIVFGQGVKISGAEQALVAFAEKANIPMASTVLGLSGVPTAHPLFMGMLGMHGNYAPNAMTQEADVILAIGMRFSDRVTGDLKTYAKQAQIVHIDIDHSEIGKNIKPAIGIHADALDALTAMNERAQFLERFTWFDLFREKYEYEYNNVIRKNIAPDSDTLTMAEVVRRVADYSRGNAVVVTDVGQ